MCFEARFTTISVIEYFQYLDYELFVNKNINYESTEVYI